MVEWAHHFQEVNFQGNETTNMTSKDFEAPAYNSREAFRLGMLNTIESKIHKHASEEGAMTNVVPLCNGSMGSPHYNVPLRSSNRMSRPSYKPQRTDVRSHPYAICQYPVYIPRIQHKL